MMSRNSALLGLSLAALLTASANPATAQTVNLRLGEDPGTLYNIQTVLGTANTIINGYILERLVYFDENGAAKPWLAESWSVSDDQTEITFKLRDGIMFSDGTPFNAEAVAAQFSAVLDPANASPQLALHGPLESVEALDDLTVKFTYGAPFASAFSALADYAGGINSPHGRGQIWRRLCPPSGRHRPLHARGLDSGHLRDAGAQSKLPSAALSRRRREPGHALCRARRSQRSSRKTAWRRPRSRPAS